MFALALVVYSPLVIRTFGFTDDYLILDWVRSDQGRMVAFDLANGRPLLIPVYLCFGLLPDIADLRWVRLATILGIACVAVGFLRIFRMQGWSDRRAWLTAAVISVLPCWQVVAAWAALVAAPVAALAAITAAALTCADSRRRLIGAALLMTSAMLTFQPAAMTYFPALSAMVLTDPAIPIQRRTVARVVTVVGSAFAVAYVTLRLGVAHAGVSGPRTTVTDDPLGKLEWFVSRALPRALDPLTLRPLPLVAVTVGLLMTLGLWRTRRLAIAVPLVVASYLPNLMVAENRPSARTMLGLMPLVVILMSMLIADIPVRRLLPTFHHRVVCLPALLAGLSALVAGWNVAVYFASPQERELAFAENAVRAVGPSPAITVRRDRFDHTLAPRVSYDEFGLPSSAMNYVTGPLIRVIYRHEFGADTRVTVLEPSQQLPSGGAVVDFGDLFRPEAATR